MLVKEVMSTHPEFLPPDASLKDIALQMREQNYGFIPVGENDRLIGTITDRDLVIRGLAEGKSWEKFKARDVMSEKVLYCYDDDDIHKAAASMQKEKVHRLIVLDHDKRLKGIVSIGDLARKCQDNKLCGEVLHDISEA